MYGQPYRGFESHPLRHFSGKDPMSLSVGENGPVARRRPKSAREAYSLYVERAIEGANEANGPLSATDAQWTVLDGEVAVPCNPQSAIAGLNSLLEGRLC